MQRPHAYSYIRMSTEAQLKGDSLRRQTELSTLYAEKHNLVLQTEFSLTDIGVSAFRGDNVSTGAFGKFLEAVKAGKIPKGSYLLVESLDRISRQNVIHSLPMFLEIIKHGVNIVTLSDEQVFQHDKCDNMTVMWSLMSLSRAHEESEIKSKRLTQAWNNKRNNLHNSVLTSLCPAWLQVTDDRKSFKVIEDRAKTIQLMFEAAANGLGSNAITRNLNEKGLKPFGKSDGWVESYVTKILKNRAVLGEFQAHQKTGGKRIPAGDAIADYFPRIVTDDLFLRVQSARRERKTKAAGRRGKNQSNLFKNIATCAYCYRPMYFVNKGKGPKGGQYLQCSGAQKGLGCISKSWRYTDFEQAFFTYVKEVNLTAIIGKTELQSEKAKLREVITAEEERLILLRAQRDRTFNLILSANAASSTYYKEKADQFSLDIAETEARLAEVAARLEAASQPSIDETELQRSIDLLKNATAPDNQGTRQLVAGRLKSIIKTLVIAVEGAVPLIEKIASRISGGGAESSAVLEKVGNDIRSCALGNRYFAVCFRDDLYRLVVPAPKSHAPKMAITLENGEYTIEPEQSLSISEMMAVLILGERSS